MANLRITKKRLRTHFSYSWWKYALAAVLCILGVSILFDMTRYRPPDEKKIQFYITNGPAQADALQRDLWPLLLVRCPEQEELIVLDIDLENDTLYGRMRLAAYIGAGEGDLLLLDASEWKEMSADGASGTFMDWTPFLMDGTLGIWDADLTAFTERNGRGTGVYALPADGLTGLSKYGCDPQGAVLAVLSGSKNKRTAAALTGILQELFSEGKASAAAKRVRPTTHEMHRHGRKRFVPVGHEDLCPMKGHALQSHESLCARHARESAWYSDWLCGHGNGRPTRR